MFLMKRLGFLETLIMIAEKKLLLIILKRKVMKLYKGITILFVLSMMSFEALASAKYCLKEETTIPIVVNIFGQSYQNNDDKRAFLNGLNKISQSFNAGDKIRIVTHTNENAKIQKYCNFLISSHTRSKLQRSSDNEHCHQIYFIP